MLGHRGDHLLHGRADALRRRPPARCRAGRARSARCARAAGSRSEHPARASNDRVRRGAVPALFQAGVVVDAHSGEMRHLFPTQPAYPPPDGCARCDDPDRLGGRVGPACPQKLARSVFAAMPEIMARPVPGEKTCGAWCSQVGLGQLGPVGASDTAARIETVGEIRTPRGEPHVVPQPTGLSPARRGGSAWSWSRNCYVAATPWPRPPDGRRLDEALGEADRSRLLPSSSTSPTRRPSRRPWRSPPDGSARSTWSSTTPGTASSARSRRSPTRGPADVRRTDLRRLERATCGAAGPAGPARRSHHQHLVDPRLTSFPGWGLYCAGKYALEGLTESLAAEVSGFGIDVNLIEPGYMRTDFLRTTLLACRRPRSSGYQSIRR